MASKKVIRKMRTTSGNVFITGRMDKDTFRPNHYGKTFKTRRGALKSDVY